MPCRDARSGSSHLDFDVDLLTSIDGVVFEDVWPRAALMRWRDLSLRILAKADLIQIKQEIRRQQKERYHAAS